MTTTMSNHIEADREDAPTWLLNAYAHWLTGSIYLDRAGNYRWHRGVSRGINLGGGCTIVPYNRLLKHQYPDNQIFHRAADRWVASTSTLSEPQP